MKDEQVKIDVDRMIDKALTYKGKHIVTICDLMTDDEDKTTTLIRGTGSNYKSKAEIFCHMNESEKTSVHLPFNIRLVRRNVDRIIVPSIRLGDDRIFINPCENDKPY
ncbi:hypothetical protein ACRS32_05725 [Staphylococcus epidermidis]|uniref:hypothetical protein n=1 Tax=Staphylococcus epidermidis TaxID=1282 RepID=UPI00119DD6DE|nr:hypothetical protein [Staphylococcus epidermidis]MBU5630382.1 hypothetical protein [Staphylococcus epidermidis]MCG1688286.1 hypothetical protein [Staphylococcus epidermidis]MCG1868230.1 hypothetical protein [Staphylococcus epidermidis]MCG2402412.1 hypothetical protein [Staphylococcus epidermidis]MCG2552610.1 hypothetical protein [Staphylococcus epidermidis]